MFTSLREAYGSTTFKVQLVVTMLVNFGVNFGIEYSSMSAWGVARRVGALPLLSPLARPRSPALSRTLPPSLSSPL